MRLLPDLKAKKFSFINEEPEKGFLTHKLFIVDRINFHKYIDDVKALISYDLI